MKKIINMFKKKEIKKEVKEKPRIKVHYLGGIIGEPKKNEVWGGVSATNYTIKRAFENSKKYELVIKQRNEFKDMVEIKKFLEGGDISWVDETKTLGSYYSYGYDRPDLIGPTTRSPIKNYNHGSWHSVYTPEWFYDGEVIRLNENEEKELTKRQEYKKNKINYLDKVTFIRHGVDTELLKPTDVSKKYILWAGDASRPAKNFQLWEDIKKEIFYHGGLPTGFEFRQMSGYAIDKFWEVLNETAVYVLTSHYESFCCAANEARAKGVPTIVKDFLTGEYMYTDQPIQVPYTPGDYAKKIIELCRNKKALEKESKIARNWVIKNCSLDTMRSDIEKVFDKIIKSKKKGGNKNA